jgi:O-antigen ligase
VHSALSATLLHPIAWWGLVAAALGFALASGVAIAASSSAALGLMLAAGIVVVGLLWVRQDAPVAAFAVAGGIFIDFYHLVALPIYFPVAPALALLLLGIMFFSQSAKRPWVRVHQPLIWAVLLVLTAIQIPRGVSTLESLEYYVGVYLSAWAAYVLGVQVARDDRQLKRLLASLTVLGAVVAVHTIIQATTGVFLLETPEWASWLAYKGNYTLSVTTTMRAGSFLINPDTDGVFMATLLPIAIGLVASSTSRVGKLLALCGVVLIAMALFFTYSNASWLAVGVAVSAYAVLVLRGRYRLYFIAIATVCAVAAVVLFPSRVQALIDHATQPGEVSLRVGTWETGIAVIQHNPLLGIGLGGPINYYVRADAYREPGQDTPLPHPHNSFLEVAAMAGLPALLAFIVLLGAAFRRALRTFAAARGPTRLLLGGGLMAVVALTVNSLGTSGWTFTPLTFPGWLILGAVASPALAASLLRKDAQGGPADAVGALGAAPPLPAETTPVPPLAAGAYIR